jgi:hypothetical protein
MFRGESTPKAMRSKTVIFLASHALIFLLGAGVAVFFEVRRELDCIDGIELLSRRGQALQEREDCIQYLKNIEGMVAYRKNEIQNGLVSGVCHKMARSLEK